MNTNIQTIRLAGGIQLVVFIASMLSERLLATAVGSGNISAKLIHLSQNQKRMRISNLFALINSLAIIVLGVFFYVVFSKEYTAIALVALGCFFAEAITLAVSKLGDYGLMNLSRDFVAAGKPESSHFQTFGNFLYSEVDRRGYDLHMLFFCLGGILWYFMFYDSGIIPQALSLWGLFAICLLSIPVLLVLYDRKLTAAMVLGLVYLPYEVTLGIWLLLMKIN